MPDNYFARYLPLLIHFLVVCALAGAIVTLSWIIGYRKPTRAKLSPYECGMTPIGDARERFSVKFYLVAMMFILFDVEAVFLYPGPSSCANSRCSASGRCWCTSPSCWSGSSTYGKRESWTGASRPHGEGKSKCLSHRLLLISSN